MRVSDLIDEDTKRTNRLLELFSVVEVEAIQNINISPLLPKDRLIWRCMKNDVFSIKSAYHLEMERISARRIRGEHQFQMLQQN